MNIPPLRREAVMPRIDGITRNIKRLREFGARPREEFLKNEDLFDLSQHHLRLALEGIFHIASHILSRIPGARATGYREIAIALGTHGIVDMAFAEDTLAKMAGYRTRLTHFYHEITPEELYSIIQNNLDDIGKFLRSIKEVLENSEKYGFTVE
ncbi:MAG: hypothetical protein G01um101433_562 [Parcubacteria group bacterium Gr01-1014_33]|nr:MAG: hypothetical protein G01um101433_562 [Parcubacteria group bacterium Gr01-1014_33]